VIYNPVIDSGFFEKSRQKLAHGWRSNQAPIVLGVGRLSKQKDFPTLVRAFRLVRDAQIARLVILGEGEDRESLSMLIRSLGLENDIDLPGFVENPFAFMSKASVFVLSSTWEGLPNVLIQALAAGAPIVSTDCPSGPREILKDGLYGELVPVGDHVSMAHAILRQLACPMQTEDRKLACSRFEQGIVIDQYKTLLFDTREELAK
jgi:glycosyltransferase involved in cell wall biosynthesis